MFKSRKFNLFKRNSRMRKLVLLVCCLWAIFCYSEGFSIETNTTRNSRAGSCVIDLDGDASDLPKIHPILVDEQTEWILPSPSVETGHSIIEIPSGALVHFSCPFSGFQHQDILFIYVTARCEYDSLFTLTLIGGTYSYSQLGCLEYPEDFAVPSAEEKCGPNNDKTLITVSYLTGPTEKTLFATCLDEDTSNSIWSFHSLFSAIGERETGSDGMPDFTPDDFYPSFDVDNAYSKISQHEAIAQLLRSYELADKYVDLNNGCGFLSRGHLAPRADFIYKNWQRSSYRFINTAPQWQCFNQYNWNYLETAVRSFYEKREINPYVSIFTGTSGILELNDVDGVPTEIWLHFDGQQRLAVPKYYWKVVYDPESLLAVVLVGVNNIYLSEDEILSVKICPEIVNHSFINSINDPDDIRRGIVFACSYHDAFSVIPEIPLLSVSGILG